MGKVSLLQSTPSAEKTPQLRLHPDRAALRVQGRSIPLLDPNQFDPQKFVAAAAHGTRVAFVQPMIPDGNYLPNLGIMSLASILIKAGYDVRVFDENVHADVQQLLLDFRPALIGYTCVTAALGSVCRAAAAIKPALPNAIIMIGGPHMSAVPKETLAQNPVIDFGITGEAERSLLMFCETVLRQGNRAEDALKAIDGLVFRDEQGQVVKNAPARFLEDDELSLLPFPAWHLLPMEDIYRKATHGLFSRGKRIMPVMTTRGCPNYCGFCCRVMGFKFRKMQLSRILTEIVWLHEKYAIDELYFEDDTFTQEPERAHELLDALVALDLGIYVKFANGLRADKVDRPLLQKMKDAGVYWVGFGIESGSPHTQALMKKNLDLEQAARSVTLAKEMGFRVGSNCIIGYPGETQSSIDESINYFLRLKLDSFAVVTCVPFPGTTAWQVCQQNGWFTKRADNYDNYWFEVFRVTPLIETPYLTAKELSNAIFWVYVRFYFLNVERSLLVARMLAKQKLGGFSQTAPLRWLRMLRSNTAVARVPAK